MMRVICGRGSPHECEMTVGPAVGVAVQALAVAVNVRVGLRHRPKLAQPLA
jgi:hypothetical protein